MASKLLNIRMDEEMLIELKEVCKELDISVTDALKLFSRKLIKERTLSVEEKNFNTKTKKEILEDLTEFCSNEEYTKLDEYISDVISEYFNNLKKIVKSEEIVKDIPNMLEKTKVVVERYKEEYGEELKNNITNRISEFFMMYMNQYYESVLASTEEYNQEMKRIEKTKYEDIMNILKVKDLKLYNELIEKYSYDINVFDMYSLNCNDYIEAKNKLEKLMTKEEISEFFKYKKIVKESKNNLEKEEYLNKLLKEDKKRYEVLKVAFIKFEAEKNGGEYISKEEMIKLQEEWGEKVEE